MFLLLIVGVLTLFVVGQPRQTMIGAVVLSLGVLVSFAVIRHPGSLSDQLTSGNGPPTQM
jgi:hypothetical protein